MNRPPGADPTAVAIGLLIFGGGAILLNLLFGAWVAFSIIAAAAISLSAGIEVRRRQSVKREHEQLEWKRILWEEWGYRSE
ncbi:hypothetical protein OG453_07385 [Streptomyces sp. NBC_01381]|uniref:hypothetical protein n=1 Tax=Streptomyces sp. NBC_01381 TaxID=2903845 RepID=UPI0022523EE6|nr:hypothetical protein [Streptomyces sp. NBC_01381]MCX4666491.1 hypothetical protein [Streptomyces sp. NBC_01381]